MKEVFKEWREYLNEEKQLLNEVIWFAPLLPIIAGAAATSSRWAPLVAKYGKDVVRAAQQLARSPAAKQAAQTLISKGQYRSSWAKATIKQMMNAMQKYHVGDEPLWSVALKGTGKHAPVMYDYATSATRGPGPSVDEYVSKKFYSDAAEDAVASARKIVSDEERRERFKSALPEPLKEISEHKIFEEWRQYLAENDQEEQKPAIVTFDFDSTLILSRWDDEKDDYVYDGPHQEMIDKLRDYHKQGAVIYIVTSRNTEKQDQERQWFVETPNSNRPVKYIPEYQMPVWKFVKEEGLPVKDVIFTNGKLKAKAEDGLVELGADIHHDDDPEENAAAEAAGIKTVISDPYGDYEDLK